MAEGKSRGWVATLVVGFVLGGVAVWWLMTRKARPKEGRPTTPVSHCTSHQSQTVTLHVQATCPGAVDHDPVALCPGDKIVWTKEPPDQSPGVNTFAVQFTTPSPTSTAPTPAPLQNPNGGKDKTTFGDNEVGSAKTVAHISNFPSDGYFDYTVTVNDGQPCDPGVIIVR
jgi:cytoskeletal protein RodZ